MVVDAAADGEGEEALLELGRSGMSEGTCWHASLMTRIPIATAKRAVRSFRAVTIDSKRSHGVEGRAKEGEANGPKEAAVVVGSASARR